MKRSEMITKLEWWLNDQLYNKEIEMADGTFIQVEDELDPESVSDFLEYMEELGMLPPDSLPAAISLAEYPTQFAMRCKKRYKWEEE